MNIFIHYLDKELLDIYFPKGYSADIIKKVSFSIKIALLLINNDECVYIPTSNYFESTLAQSALEPFRDIVDLGYIEMVSSSRTLKDFLKKKKKVYPEVYTKEQIAEEEEKILDNNVPGIWTQRQESATADIISSWSEDIDNIFWSQLYNISNYKDVNSLEKDLAEIPIKLKENVFIASNVLPELKIIPGYEFEAKEIINRVISKYYISSFLEEYHAICFENFFLLSQANDILPEGYDHIDYTRICRKLSAIPYEEGQSLYSYIDKCDNQELMLLKEKKVIYDSLNNCVIRKQMISEGGKSMKTFIVHGHDSEVKLALKNYLQNTLKMEEPIILAEKASKGLTIMEKFEKYSQECNLVFVLLTPDDKYSNTENYRARQNVIFEMGYFLGKLGRDSGRVILLYKGNLDLPNDISGLVYINIDNGIEAAGEEIRREINDI